MFSNWFSSLYRVFLVLFESLQVLSWLWGKIGHLEPRRRKQCNLVIFTQNSTIGCSRSSGGTRAHVPTAEIFKETTTYFGICPNLFIFSPSRLWLPYNFFFWFSHASFYTKNHWRLLYLKICYLEREKASSLSPWKDSWTLSYLFIDSTCFLHILSLWFICSWLSSRLLGLGC